jgi:endo-1,4-beta-xylanase
MTRKLLACGLLAALAACGGSDSPTQPPTPSPSTALAPPPGPPWNEVAPLRDAAAASRRFLGAAVFSSGLASDAVYAGAAGRHFNDLTAEWEMKWDPTEKTRGQFDFSGGDAIAAFAEAHGMRVKGHALIWHQATPSWVEALSSAELRIAVEDHIRAVAGHYRGRVRSWDVVNEAIDDSTLGLRSTVFSRGLGPDYIAEAFRLARQADPEAELIYNDYSAEGMGGKSDAVYALVKDLEQRRVPIQGVGLQMHIAASGFPPLAEIAANMRRLGALGLKVNISEMDVRISGLSGDLATRLQRQREVYHDVVAVCVAEPACEAVTFWGFTDAHTWVDGFFGPDDPLLFDEHYYVKPAFYGVQDAYLRR